MPLQQPAAPSFDVLADLSQRFTRIRARTEALAAPLSAEDCQAQGMADASPVKWHLAHVSWFFETFVLEPFEPGFVPFDAAFKTLFNSYYNGVGDKFPRPTRSLLTRPSLAQVLAWRAQVDARVLALLASGAGEDCRQRIELGLHHEQQHQELMCTDVKHLLAQNWLQPVYTPNWPLAPVAAVAQAWVPFAGGLVQVGHSGTGFCFDNELPRHRVHVEPYALQRRLVTHGDWLQFVQAGGYQDHRWWLAAGWDWLQAEGLDAPLYWQRAEDGWVVFTLHGTVPLDPLTPVVHVSYYEADAYARWAAAELPDHAGARLPTEAEWEAAVAPNETTHQAAGNFADTQALHPMPCAAERGHVLHQAMGDVWQWTSSSYNAYPGFAPAAGAVGEYNGKFMVNQYVLRGGSCATPADHIRATYRNFFPAHARWQFTGLRLARAV